MILIVFNNYYFRKKIAQVAGKQQVTCRLLITFAEGVPHPHQRAPGWC